MAFFFATADGRAIALLATDRLKKGGKAVRLFIRVFAIVWSSGSFLGLFAQDTTTRSGFAIVTPVSGNIGGLVATETLRNRTNTDIEQTVVGPSPLITSASLLVVVGPIGENTTALAVANPSAGNGGVNLMLTDGIGGLVLNTSLQLGPRGQFSAFLNEFFPTQPEGFSTPLLLTLSSELPIAVLALNFRGNSFAAIPLTSLSTPTPVPLQPLFPPPQSPPLPGFGLGLPPAPFTPVFTIPPGAQDAPPATIGGNTSMIFAQIADGGGWSTEIAVGNTSAGTQIVRVDFFSPNGANIGSIEDIVIQPRGVFFFSTDPVVAGIR
jgi:hypothetical protein